MSKKKTTPKQAYIIIDTNQDQVVAVGDLDYVIKELEEYIDLESYGDDEIEWYIRAFELGKEKQILAHTRFDITIGQ